jgi:hypothetical protein
MIVADEKAINTARGNYDAYREPSMVDGILYLKIQRKYRNSSYSRSQRID